ncbi:MAG: F0F1 ATP synthase subunit A [Planctomycetota bacterium]
MPRFFDHQFGAIWFNAIVGALLILITFFVLLQVFRKHLSVSSPINTSYTTAFFEGIVMGLTSIFNDLTGGKVMPYIPYIVSIFLFILLSNLMGIIPGLAAPTMTLSTTLGLSFLTIILVQYWAIKQNGFVGYIKHFLGEILWLGPFFLVLEIISELTKIASLALRLFGNIFGKDMVIETVVSLSKDVMPFGVIPIPFQMPLLLLAIITSFVQAFIFSALTSVYIARYLEHHKDEETHS